MTRVGAVVLAAGASTRLGEPKQLLMWKEERLVERAVRIASDACISVVLVLGANAEAILKTCRFKDVSIVLNEAWDEGMGSSIRVGVEGLGKVDGTIVMTCDMPAVTGDHLERLSQPGVLSASSYAGRRGVPAYFPAALFPELLQLKGEAGARDLLHEARLVELLHGEMDIDTIDDFEQAKVFDATKEQLYADFTASANQVFE